MGWAIILKVVATVLPYPKEPIEFVHTHRPVNNEFHMWHVCKLGSTHTTIHIHIERKGE